MLGRLSRPQSVICDRDMEGVVASRPAGPAWSCPSLGSRPAALRLGCSRPGCWSREHSSKQASARYTPDATTWVRIKRQHDCPSGRMPGFFQSRKGRRKSVLAMVFVMPMAHSAPLAVAGNASFGSSNLRDCTDEQEQQGTDFHDLQLPNLSIADQSGCRSVRH
jgi:hypothetical protein